MKLSMKSFYKIALCFLILLDTCFLFLYKTTGIMNRILSEYNKTCLVLVALAVVLFHLLIYRKNKIKFDFLTIYLFVSSISYLFIFAFSLFNYPGQKIYNLFFCSSHFLMIWFAIPLLYVFKKDNGIYRLFRLINYFVFLIYIMLIIQFVIYELFSFEFLAFITGTRNNNIRISLSVLGNFLIIYNFWCVRYEKFELVNVINLILGLVCLIFIQQTRMYYIIIFSSMLLLELSKKNNKFFKIIIFLLLIIVIIVLFSQAFYDFYYDLVSLESPNNTILIRLHAIDYFVSAFINNPIFGHGFISNVEYQNIATGPFQKYFYADVGFFGLMAQTGIFSFVFVGVLIFRWVSIIKKIKNSSVKYFLKACLVFSILSMISLSLFDPQRILLVPILIAIFEFFNYKLISKKYYYNKKMVNSC